MLWVLNSVLMMPNPNIQMTSCSRPSFWFFVGIFSWSSSTNGSVHSCHMKAPHCQKRRDLVKWHDRQKTAYRIGFIYQVFPSISYTFHKWLNACLYHSLTSGVFHLQTWSPTHYGGKGKVDSFDQNSGCDAASLLHTVTSAMQHWDADWFND